MAKFEEKESFIEENDGDEKRKEGKKKGRKKGVKKRNRKKNRVVILIVLLLSILVSLIFYFLSEGRKTLKEKEMGINNLSSDQKDIEKNNKKEDGLLKPAIHEF